MNATLVYNENTREALIWGKRKKILGHNLVLYILFLKKKEKKKRKQ